jgi:hypothetical protein
MAITNPGAFLLKLGGTPKHGQERCSVERQVT